MRSLKGQPERHVGGGPYEQKARMVHRVHRPHEIYSRRAGSKYRQDWGETLLQTVFDSLYDAIFLHEADGTIIAMNEPALRMYGLSRKEFAGLSIIRDLSTSADDIENLPRRWQAALAGQEQIFEWKARRPHDGSEFPAEVFLRQLVLQGRSVLLANVRDISARQRAAEAEREAREAAIAANAAKDRFLAVLSHELRTPLNAILLWAQLLRMPRVSPAEIQQGLLDIERNVKVQARLLEDLLDVSRIISGKMRLNCQPVQLARVVTEAVATVHPGAEQKGVSLGVDVGSTDWTVMGDSARLQQILLNLLNNAIKFTPAGGHVQVRLTRQDDRVQMIVSDNGRGIASDRLPHIFERFLQVDSSTTRVSHGLGLGLSIVKQLAEMHGGSVSAASAGEGRGATFSVTLPLLAEPCHEAAPLPPAELAELGSVDLQGCRVLVVDDEISSGELVQRVLESCGAQVRVARSAPQALAMLRQEPPDVLLADIAMPGQDGYELISQVRRDYHGNVPPAAALTALARAEDRNRAFKAGFCNHITKPVDPRELVRVVRELADMAHLAACAH